MRGLKAHPTWYIAETPIPELAAWSESRPAWFAASAWADALQALGARCLFAWHRERQRGLVVPVFTRLGFLRLAFLGFPICPLSEPSEREALSASLLAGGHCQTVRLSLPMLPKAEDMRSEGERPDVWIENLESWRPSSRLRRDLAYARRHLGDWELVRESLEMTAAARLYAEVIARHRGQAVYNTAYFGRLGSARHPGLFVFGLCDGQGQLRAFAILAIHEDTGFYLHAAADEEARRRGAGDLLLEAVVEQSRRSGCLRLDLMASPPRQSGLIAFKRKWGDRLGVCTTQHTSRGLIGRAMQAALAFKLKHGERRG